MVKRICDSVQYRRYSTKRLASERVGVTQFLVCHEVDAAQLSLPGTQAASLYVMTLEPTNWSGDTDGRPAGWRPPCSMMSISPLRGQACGLVPSIHSAGHRPTPTDGVAARISIIPYLTCTLPAESSLPEVNWLLPITSRLAVRASARVPGSNGTLTMLRLLGL